MTRIAAFRVYVQDAAVALLLVVVTRLFQVDATPGITEKNAAGFTAGFYLKDPASWWAFGALIVAGLLIQHRWPLAAVVLASTGAALQLEQLRADVPTQPLQIAVPITLYTLAAHGRARWVAVVAAAVLMVAIVVSPVARSPGRWDAALTVTFFGAAPTLVVLVAAFALGDAVRSRRAHLHAVERRAEDRAALATAAERARITRELHDVVAHGLSVIVMQAQGGAAVLRQHPDRTAEALQNVIVTGRAAMADMRTLLGMAREGAQLDPPPGVDALPLLIERVRAAGTPVTLAIHGSPVPLPANVDLSAYRITQEALTNTMKHAGTGARAMVRVAFAAGGLEIEVSDDGIGCSSGDRLDGGNGLRGIAERVGMLGGDLSVGPGESGGFRVRALLPLVPA